MSREELLMSDVERIPYFFVPLSRGKVAIIDVADAPRVLERTWCCQLTRDGIYYALTNIPKHERAEPGAKQIQLHRFIMDAPSGFLVDHINGDTLDCRRQNMRLATCGENARNRRKKGGAFPYKGVYVSRNRFFARIEANGEKRSLGGFASMEEAARAYDRAAIEMHGDFACLNFPKDH